MQYIVMQSEKDGLRVYGNNLEFLRSRGSEIICHGPAETGKTFAACLKLHLCALKYPHSKLAIIRKTQTSCYDTIVKTYTDKILGKDIEKWPCIPYGGTNRPKQFNYYNGSTIIIAGMDKASKVLSAEFDMVLVNQAEELTLDDWEIITTRTTGRAGNMPYAQTIGDANPSYPTHWMYHRDSLRLYYSKHTENPSLFNQLTGEITEQGKRTMRTLEKLTGMRRERLLHGRPSRAEGIIYEEYNASIHRVYEKDLPQIRRWIGGVDWGFTHAGVLGMWGLDKDDSMYLRGQVYRTGKLVEWFIDKAKMLEKKFGRAEVWVCDPSEPAYIKAFQRAGLNAIAGYNAVNPGINAIKTRLKNNRIFFVRDNLLYPDQGLIAEKKVHCIEDEILSYVWANTKQKELPVKENDHALDQARYVVCYVDGIGKKRKKIAGAWRSET